MLNANLAECTLHLAFPFWLNMAKRLKESGVYSKRRYGTKRSILKYVNFLKISFFLPKKSVTFVPFWSGNQMLKKRTDRKDFANTRVHILAVI